MRSPEQVVRHFQDCLDRGDVEDAADLFAEDAVNFGHRVGRAGILAILRSLDTAFPDAHGEIVDLISAGDVVACRITMTGTHLGTPELPIILGGLLRDEAPTGQRIEVASQHWYRVHDGKITEHWAVRDDLTMGRQLGLIP